MANTFQSTGLETASAYHRAWTSGDLDAAFVYVADDIICRAPAGDIIGKDAYRSYLNGFSQMMTGLTDVAAFGDDMVESRLVFDRLSFGPPAQQ